MKSQKSNTEEYFSTDGLISILSEIEPTKDFMEIDIEIKFKDAIVEVVGTIHGCFHEREIKNDTPQYSNLYDVKIVFSSVSIKYKTDYFEKRVRSLMLN